MGSAIIAAFLGNPLDVKDLNMFIKLKNIYKDSKEKFLLEDIEHAKSIKDVDVGKLSLHEYKSTRDYLVKRGITPKAKYVKIVVRKDFPKEKNLTTEQLDMFCFLADLLAAIEDTNNKNKNEMIIINETSITKDAKIKELFEINIKKLTLKNLTYEKINTVISNIPDKIAERIEELTINDSEFKKVKELVKFKSVIILNLNNNKIQKKSLANLFLVLSKKLKSVKELHLAENDIEILEDDKKSFENIQIIENILSVESLEKLDISGNKILLALAKSRLFDKPKQSKVEILLIKNDKGLNSENLPSIHNFVSKFKYKFHELNLDLN